MDDEREKGHPQDLPPGLENFLYILPNGQVINFSQIFRHRRENLESQLSTGLLWVGDFVTFEHKGDGEDETEKYLFAVKEAAWQNLSVGGSCPSPKLKGTLVGAGIPSEIAGQDVVFTGSSLGGSSIMPGTFGTNLLPIFTAPKGLELMIPSVDYFQILRRDASGDLLKVEPNRLVREAEQQIPHHEQRLKQVDYLIKIFGFDYDFRNGRVSLPLNAPDLVYDDKQYHAQLELEMAMGNTLAILDKRNRMWMEFKYYNFQDNDLLQVGFADLSGHNLTTVFPTGRISEEHRVKILRVPITTFNTSRVYGIDVINFQPSDHQAREFLKTPQTGEKGEVFIPNI